jgi:hypothetical protein
MPLLDTNRPGVGEPPKTRIVILGGGFGGVTTARHLERLCKRRQDVEIVLVSRDNFLLMTPLLFEVCSGALDARHCSFPIRAFLRTTRFVESAVQSVDLERRVVHLSSEGERDELAYDQLVFALGGLTNRRMIPGSEHAFTFKALADAFLLRNHVIERFERRRRAGPRAQAPPAHLRGHRRRAGRRGVVRRADRLRGRDRAAVQARQPRRGPVHPARGRGPHHAGDRPQARRLRGRGAPQAARGRRPHRGEGAGHRAGQAPPGGRDDRGGDHRPGSGHRPQPGRCRVARGERPPWPRRRRCDDALPQPPGGVGAGRLRGRPGAKRPTLPQPRAARLARGEGARSKRCRGARRPAPPSRSSTPPWG